MLLNSSTLLLTDSLWPEWKSIEATEALKLQVSLVEVNQPNMPSNIPVENLYLHRVIYVSTCNRLLHLVSKNLSESQSFGAFYHKKK